MAKQRTQKTYPVRVVFEVKRAIEDATDTRIETIGEDDNLREHVKLTDAMIVDVLEILEIRFRVIFSDDEEMSIETVRDIINLMKTKLQEHEVQELQIQ